jgi:hypothetical protein
MSDLLTLARDYIDRMANPVYGIATNEDYAIRFAKLFESEGFEAQIRAEIRTLRSRDALTSYGWLWLIGWAKSRRIDLNEELLVELFEQWSGVFVRSAIIDLATQSAEYESQGRRKRSLLEFPNRFLAQIMRLATEGEEEDRPLDEQRRSTGRAESVLIALLQVDKPITLDAASALLQYEWWGREQLLEYFWALSDTLDAETRSVWIERLEPPHGPR